MTNHSIYVIDIVDSGGEQGTVRVLAENLTDAVGAIEGKEEGYRVSAARVIEENTAIRVTDNVIRKLAKNLEPEPGSYKPRGTKKCGNRSCRLIIPSTKEYCTECQARADGKSGAPSKP